jgi:hypothetical protein
LFQRFLTLFREKIRLRQYLVSIHTEKKRKIEVFIDPEVSNGHFGNTLIANKKSGETFFISNGFIFGD